MKNRFIEFQQLRNLIVSAVMLLLLLAGIFIIYFHDHQFDEQADTCAICYFLSSYSTVTVAPESSDIFILAPLAELALILNERATDPSRTLVFHSHAPPYIP